MNLPPAAHIYIASVLTNAALHAYFRSSPVSNLPQAFLSTSKAMSAITICSTFPPFCFTCTRAKLSAAASQPSYIQKDHTKTTQVRISTSSLEGACYMTLHLAYHITLCSRQQQNACATAVAIPPKTATKLTSDATVFGMMLPCRYDSPQLTATMCIVTQRLCSAQLPQPCT